VVWDDVFRIKGDDEGHGILNAPTSTESDLDHESTGAHAPQPNPPNPKKRPGTDPDLDRDHRANLEDPQPPGPAPPKRPDYKNEAWHVQQPKPSPSKPGYSNPGYGYENLDPVPSDSYLRLMPADEYLKTWNVPLLESSEVYPSSDSVPAGSDPESTTEVQAPAPNPTSSTANPDPLLEPAGPSVAVAAPMQGS
jgi:hypothetical protein